MSEGRIIEKMEDHYAGLLQSMNDVGSSVVLNIMKMLWGSSVPGHKTTPPPPIFVHPNLLTHIMLTLYPTMAQPKWKSPQQAEAVASSFGKEHVFVILPTGGGKSLVFFSAPILFPKRLFIVILPLVALTENMMLRLRLMPYQTGIFGEKDLDIINTQLLVVSAHRAGTREFEDFLHLPSNYDRIERIFIDEVHHIKEDTPYRHCFPRLAYLTTLGKPFTLLSATLGPSDIPCILSQLHIPEDAPIREIRAYTGRPNHVITHQRVKVETLIDDVVQYVISLPQLEEAERGLIFTSEIKTQCIPIATKLGFAPFYADLEVDQKKKLQDKWIAGKEQKSRWLVATSAFGEGIDQDRVKYVIAVEPYGLGAFLQFRGRSGRDGQRAFCHVIWTNVPRVTKRNLRPEDDLQNALGMVEFYQTNQCLRFPDQYYDVEAHSCAALAAELCQNCEEVC